MPDSLIKQIGKLLQKKKKEDTEEEGALSLDTTESTPKWKTGDRVTLRLEGLGDVVVPRGDMSEDEWNSFIAEAQKKEKLRSPDVVVESTADKKERAETGKVSKVEDRPKSDYMEVTIGKGRSEIAVVPRGDMDQTTWEALKTRAKKMGVFKGSNDTGKEGTAEVVSDSELDKRVGPETGSTGMDAAAEEPAEVDEPAPVDPEGDRSMLKELQTQSSTEGSHGVKRFVEQGMAGTVGGRGGNVGTVQSIDQPATGVPTARNAGVKAGNFVRKNVMPVMEQMPVVQGAKMAIEGLREVPGAMEGIGAFIQGAIDPTGAAQTTAQQGSGVMVPPPPPQSQRPPGTVPDTTGLPPMTPATMPGQGQTQTGSVTATKKGGPVPDIGMPDRSAEINRLQAEADQATRAQANIEAEGLRRKGELFDQGLQEQTRQQAKLAEVQERVMKEREQPMRLYSQMLSELTQPTQKIDPHRWWNSRDTGQKIAAALGALLTRGGSIGMIQHAIDADIAAQQSDISNEMNRKKTVLGAADNMLAMIRQQGADDVQAVKLATALSWDMVSKRLEMVATNTDSQTIKLKAEQNIAEANVKRNQALTEMDKYSADLAIRKAHLANESEQIKINWMKAHRAGQGGQKLQGMKGPQVENFLSNMDAIMTAKRYSKEFKANASGFFSKLFALDPTGTTDAAKYNSGREAVIQLIGRALEGGVLREGDIPRYRNMIPEAGDLKGAQKWDRLILELNQRLGNKVAGFGAAGFNVGALPEMAGSVGQQTVPSFEPDEDEDEE